MNLTGLLIGVTTIFIIGIFHPLVIWAEYYFSKRIWFVFLIFGLFFIAASLAVKSDVLSCILAVLSASCIWSIRELFQQEKRVAKGLFPKKKPSGKDKQ